MSLSTLYHLALGLLALVGVAAIAIVLMLASPVRRPPTLASIHAGATQIDETGAPDLSRFQARDGTWLAYRLYLAPNGARDRIAILAHGSSASAIEMNAVAKALAGAGVTAVALDIRGHGASGTRGDIAYAGGLSDPVAAVVFCAPTRARHTVVGGRLIVDDGEIVTLDMAPVIRAHNRNAARLAALPV